MIGGAKLVGLPVRREEVRPQKYPEPVESFVPAKSRTQWVKRAVDLLAVSIGGLLILPFLLTIALLVWLESGGGPIFYADKRFGRGGKSFSCLKFRTMLPDGEEKLRTLLQRDPEAYAEYALYHKLRNDPRVTRVGRFLRKTSLDELPQLWNVLRGEMSLVGPRPYLLREEEELGTARRDLILTVLPGMTGLWQVSGRSELSFEDRIALDCSYVRDQSVLLDFSILLRTFYCVVRRHGAC